MASYWNSVVNKRTITRRRALGLAASGLGGAALLAACGGSSDSTPSPDGDTAQTEGTPKSGGRFGTNTADVNNLNIVSSWREGTQLGGATVYDRPLTAREDERRYVLEAMESIEQSDPLTVVMKLKAGMVYQNLAPVNGRAVKADDIVATQTYVTGLADAFDKNFQVDTLDSAQAPDDRTVIYKLKKPSAYVFGGSALGNANSQGIIPKETLDQLSTQRQVGSGPWYLDEYSINSRYLYKRFDKFRDASKGLPYFDEKEIFVFTDIAPTEAAFKSGQIHEWRSAPPAQLDRLERELGGTAKFYKAPGVQPYCFHLNMERGLPWQTDVRVREAFWRATDRKQILDLVFAGRGVVPPGLLPAGLKAYQLESKDTEQFFKTDVAKAKQLLSAASFDLGKEYRVLGYSHEQTAQAWQQQLSQVGIKTRIEGVTSNEIFNRWSANDFDTTITGSPNDNTPYQALRLQHTKGWSTVFRHFGLQDSAIDALVEKSEQAVDPEENVKLVKEVQMEAIKKFSSSYYYLTRDYYDVVSAKIKGWEVIQSYPNYRSQAWFE